MSILKLSEDTGKKLLGDLDRAFSDRKKPWWVT